MLLHIKFKDYFKWTAVSRWKAYSMHPIQHIIQAKWWWMRWQENSNTDLKGKEKQKHQLQARRGNLRPCGCSINLPLLASFVSAAARTTICQLERRIQMMDYIFFYKSWGRKGHLFSKQNRKRSVLSLVFRCSALPSPK